MINEERTITLGSLKITAYISSENPNRYVIRKNGGPATLSQEQASALVNWIRGTLPPEIPTVTLSGSLPGFAPQPAQPTRLEVDFSTRKAKSSKPLRPPTVDTIDVAGVETFDMEGLAVEAQNGR